MLRWSYLTELPCAHSISSSSKKDIIAKTRELKLQERSKRADNDKKPRHLGS